MLTDREKLFLAKSIDQLLQSKDQEQLDRLLSMKAEARTYLANLKKIQKLHQQSTPARLPVDISAVVVAKINVPASIVRSNEKLASRIKWLSLALAASLFFVVGAFSSWFFIERNSQTDRGFVVKSNKQTPSNRVDRNQEISREIAKKDTVEGYPQIIEPEAKVEVAVAPELLPEPRAKIETPVLTNPFQPLEVELVDPKRMRLSLILPLQDLAQDYPKQRLTQEISRTSQVRVDLFTTDVSRGFDRLVNHAKSFGFQPVFDAQAIERRKKTQDLLIYSDSLTDSEIQQLISALGIEDHKLSQQSKSDGIFDQLVLHSLSKFDLDRFSPTLGLPLSLNKNSKKPVGIDLQKPLSESTAKALVSTLAKPSGTSMDRTIVILPYQSMGPILPASKEIRSALDQRGHRKPDAKPLFMLLRSSNQ